MKRTFRTYALAFLAGCCSFVSVTAQTGKSFFPASSSQIVYMGRTSHTFPDSVRFTYPGVTLFANFEGTSLQMKARPGSGSFMVEIDRQPAIRVTVYQNDSIVTLAEGLVDTLHSARIMYILEGYHIKPAFLGLYLDKGRKLGPAPRLPERRIEFIGNSITCGYGVESDNARDPFTYETENHYYTYAALTARALHAQHLVVARSGIGIYRNYNGPTTGSPDCMPAMYEQTLFTDPSEEWDHSLYTPDVVCINLGTNDTGTGKYDMGLLTDGYRQFVKRIRSHYPKAKIVLLSGSMMNGRQLADVKKAMDTVAGEFREQGDTGIYRFDMSPQTGSLGYGASYHPSRRQQMKMASELTGYLRLITGWN